ncbi:MAG: ABC transporter substrate-binding protein [Parvularculales bacterium]
MLSPMRLITSALVALLVSAPTPATSAEKITLALDWFINPDHAPIIIAQQKGFFADEGLDVEIIEPANPNDPPKLVAAGRMDLAISYQPQLHLHVDAGLPLKRIATLVATPLNALVVLDDGPVQSIADLSGRKVGFSVGGFEDALLRAMLERHGLSLDDIELVNVNFSLTPALLSGQVSAVIGAFRNFELNQLALNNASGRAFYVEEEGVPVYDELIVVAHTDKVNQPAMSAFVRALERGVLYTINHPEESWELFSNLKPELDDELNRRAWRDTLPRLALRPAAIDTKRYEHFAIFLAKQGLIQKPLPASAYTILPH